MRLFVFAILRNKCSATYQAPVHSSRQCTSWITVSPSTNGISTVRLSKSAVKLVLPFFTQDFSKSLKSGRRCGAHSARLTRWIGLVLSFQWPTMISVPKGPCLQTFCKNWGSAGMGLIGGCQSKSHTDKRYKDGWRPPLFPSLIIGLLGTSSIHIFLG